MKPKKFLLAVIAILALLSIIIFGYEYNRKAPDVAGLDAQPITAESLFKAFNSNEQHANEMYRNKPLLVSGKVMEVKKNANGPLQVILDAGDPMFGVACTLDNTKKELLTGSLVTIKGICTGYLNDVIITSSLLQQ